MTTGDFAARVIVIAAALTGAALFGYLARAGRTPPEDPPDQD